MIEKEFEKLHLERRLNFLSVDEINYCIKNNGIDTNKISDGYHTFGELYEHRITLFIALLRKIDKEYNNKNIPSPVWKSEVHSDGSVWDGWFILGIFSDPGSQITYHLPTYKWAECKFAIALDKAPEWDGHTSEDVLKRLQAL
jgi:hypothetical protein